MWRLIIVHDLTGTALFGQSSIMSGSHQCFPVGSGCWSQSTYDIVVTFVGYVTGVLLLNPVFFAHIAEIAARQLNRPTWHHS